MRDKEKQKIYMRKYRQEHRAQAREHHKKWKMHPHSRKLIAGYNRKLTQSKREIIRKAKDKPCMDCGIKYGYWIMQFDHKPGEIKLYTIAAHVSSMSKIKIMNEIAKCDVVCANCHAERTYKRQQGEE